MRKGIAALGFVFLLCSFLFTGCTKKADGITGPAGPAGNPGGSADNGRSAITGFVRLVSQFSFPVSDYDSVQVSTRMGDSLITVATDKTGKFILPALKSGNYRLLFRRNGYDSLAVNVVHSAGNEDKFIGIVEIDGTLTTHIQDQTVELINSHISPGLQYVEMTSTLDGPALTDYTRRYFSVYFSRSADVSDQHFIFQYNGNTNNEGANQTVAQIYFQGPFIGTTPVNTGDSIYVKTYFIPSPLLQTTWFDTDTYQNIPYPYKGDSIVKSFIWAN